jgi:hypothetical protein
MNLDAIELRITLINYFAILAMKCHLPDASHFARNKIAEEIFRVEETFWCP